MLVSTSWAAVSVRSRVALKVDSSSATVPRLASSTRSRLLLSWVSVPSMLIAVALAVLVSFKSRSALTRALISILPAALTTKSSAVAAASPSMRTPTPASVATMAMRLAYMPPSTVESKANEGAAPLPAMGVAVRVAQVKSLAPVVIPTSVPTRRPSTLMLRATRSSRRVLLASMPAPLIRMSPCMTRKPSSVPPAPICGRPVVSTARSVLMKPQPEQVMP